MTTGFFLLDTPNRVQQYGATRRNRATPSGTVVLHTAENVTDFDGPDPGAENVAGFIARRGDYGSYHALADADSVVRMLPWSYEAWQDTRTNNFAVGIAGAVRSGDWPALGARGDLTVLNMAALAREYAAWLLVARGIRIPARWLTRAQALNREPGFIGHGEIDTGRRSDPGGAFNRQLFLSAFAGSATPVPQPTPAPAPALNADGSLRLALDGSRGPGTIGRWQEVMGTTIDFAITGYPPGSSLIRADQAFLNTAVSSAHIRNLTGKPALAEDGDEGRRTITVRQFLLYNRLAQRVLGRPARGSDFDGSAGPQTTRLHQVALNEATRGARRY